MDRGAKGGGRGGVGAARGGGDRGGTGGGGIGARPGGHVQAHDHESLMERCLLSSCPYAILIMIGADVLLTEISSPPSVLITMEVTPVLMLPIVFSPAYGFIW